MFDGQKLGEDISGFVRTFMERELAPIKSENEALKVRLAALEARPAPEKGETGEKGQDGNDGFSPAPELVVEAFRPLADSLIAEAVAKAVADLPRPEKGEVGEAGPQGAPGANGRDGRGVRELLIDRDGNLIATMDDGEMKSLGPVVGKDGTAGEDGASGKDGRDGFGFDDMDACVLDDDRTIELSFRRGEEEKCFTFKWPTAIYRGVFSVGTDYQAGDMVTWGGSLWHCDTPTKDKPGTDSWTLAAKKGRDGKDAKVG
jgi:hypothetical protein